MSGTIWGDRIGIRPLRPTDATVLRRFMADPAVADLLFEDKGPVLPSTLAIALNFLGRRLANEPYYAIVEKSGRVIGSVNLSRLSERNKSGTLTIFIGERTWWGRGYGTEALRLFLGLLFKSHDLYRVELHVFAFNGRAIRSYEKVGFIREGARRQALLRDGQYHDVVVMGILRDEFLAREAERQSVAITRE